MAVDWDADVLGPVMDVFGEGDPADASTWPIYAPQSAAPFPLQGAVFDKGFKLVKATEDGETLSSGPTLGVRDALFASKPVQGDRVYVPSADTTFEVLAPEPDGHGHTKLLLNRVAAGNVLTGPFAGLF